MSVSDIENNNQEKRQGNLTLYGAGSDLNDLSQKVRAAFGPNAIETLNEDEKGFEIMLLDKSIIKVAVVSDPKIMFQQTMGMSNFFSKAPLKDERLKAACINQIKIFTSIIGFTFEITDSKDRMNVIVGSINKLARMITAFILYPNMRLHHPEGKLLISVEGMSDFDEYYPLMCRNSSDVSMENDKDKARKERTIDILKARKIPYAERMEVSAYDEISVIPDKETIIKRAICVFAASVKSEVYNSGRYDNPTEFFKDEFEKLEKNYGIRECLSVEEKAYIDNEQPDEKDINKFGWRYECCAVLMWALGLMELKEPRMICDAAELGAIVWNNDFDSLMEKADVRDRDEILDMQDLLHRYDWACIEAQIKKFELPMFDSTIVFEWHYALNWLTGVDKNTDWDKVPRKA